MPNPHSQDEARLDAFVDILVAKLYQVPTPEETSRFLSADADTRTQMIRSWKKRAAPLIATINEIKSWKNV